MQEEQVIGENGEFITVRVAKSGNYKVAEEGFVRQTIATARLNEIVPDYNLLPPSKKQSKLEEFGIKLCVDCSYPQPVENRNCCFCNELMLK